MVKSSNAPSRAMVLLATVAMGLILLLATAVHAGSGAPTLREYRVQSGDSLWSIAAATRGPEGDIRAAVHDIKRINGLDGVTILTGQVLLLPGE